MNKKKIGFIIVGAFIIIVFLVILATNSNIDLISLKGDISSLNGLSIECEKDKISVDEYTKCVLILDSGLYNITGFQGKLSSNSNIKISNIKKNSIWSFGADDTKEILYYNETPLSGRFQIAIFDVKGISKGTGVITIDRNNNDLLIMTDVNDNKDINLRSKNFKIRVE